MESVGIFTAIASGDTKEAMRLLCKRIKVPKGEIICSLALAAQRGYVALVAKLLRTGIDPNDVDTEYMTDGVGLEPMGMTALRAVLSQTAKPLRQDMIEILGLLIENGADVNQRDASGATPLFSAVYQYRTPEAVLRTFIIKGVNNFDEVSTALAKRVVKRARFKDLAVMLKPRLQPLPTEENSGLDIAMMVLFILFYAFAHATSLKIDERRKPVQKQRFKPSKSFLKNVHVASSPVQGKRLELDPSLEALLAI